MHFHFMLHSIFSISSSFPQNRNKTCVHNSFKLGKNETIMILQQLKIPLTQLDHTVKWTTKHRDSDRTSHPKTSPKQKARIVAGISGLMSSIFKLPSKTCRPNCLLYNVHFDIQWQNLQKHHRIIVLNPASSI